MHEINLQQLANQYEDATLADLVEEQVRKLDQATLLQAIRGTFDELPERSREFIDSFTQEYTSEWLRQDVFRIDLSTLFVATISDIRRMSEGERFCLSDDQIFGVFNIMVMKISHFAHQNSKFRKHMGIKKGWFS